LFLSACVIVCGAIGSWLLKCVNMVAPANVGWFICRDSLGSFLQDVYSSWRY